MASTESRAPGRRGLGLTAPLTYAILIAIAGLKHYRAAVQNLEAALANPGGQGR